MNENKGEKLDSNVKALDYSVLSKQDLWYLTQIEYVRYTVPWFILFIGIVGNTFILLIFTKRLKKRNSNAFCFCVLAISDIIALVFMLLRALLVTELLKNLMISCKLISFLYSFSLQLSSWCLVLLTLDRLAAVTFIFSYPSWSKKFHIIKIFIGVVVILFLANIHLVIFVTSNETLVKTSGRNLTRKYFCSVDSNKYPFYDKYVYSYWDIYHATIYNWLPFLIILVSNIIIIIKLNYYRYRNFSGSKRSLNQTNSSSIRPFQLTIMLLTVAFAFLILTCPISIFMVIFYSTSNESQYKLAYIRVILRYIAYIHNAISFYLYIGLSNEFRREFILLFKSPTHKIQEQVSDESTKITKISSSTSNRDLYIVENNQEKLKNLWKTKNELVQKIKLPRLEEEDEENELIIKTSAV